MDRNDPLRVKPAYRHRSAGRAPLIDDDTGLPALANLACSVGVEIIAGILARIAAGDSDDVPVLAGADPVTGRPVWATVSESCEDEGAAYVQCYDGHPDDDASVDGGGWIEGALAAFGGDCGSPGAVLTAANAVYDLVVRETT